MNTDVIANKNGIIRGKLHESGNVFNNFSLFFLTDSSEHLFDSSLETKVNFLETG